jgi:hypothetical protein
MEARATEKHGYEAAHVEILEEPKAVADFKNEVEELLKD